MKSRLEGDGVSNSVFKSEGECPSVEFDKAPFNELRNEILLNREGVCVFVSLRMTN